MLATSLSLSVLLGATATTTASTEYVAEETTIHLGISLRIAHAPAMWQLHQAQQDARSPLYHHWIGPEDFGERFGQPVATYELVAAWLEAAGFHVIRSPNRTFIEALGAAGHLTRLLGVRLRRVSGRPASVHLPDGVPRLPPEISPLVLHISGLDTRVRFHHHLAIPTGKIAFGPQDLRRFYDVEPLLASGRVGQGQQLVVLGAAPVPGAGPSTADIAYFLQNVSDSSTTYVQQVLANPQNDFDAQLTAGIEYALDAEMQSVGAPGADSITLVLAPASEVFTAGPNYIVNNLPSATAVSVSLGDCEPNVEVLDQLMGTHEETAVRQLIVQGVMEGQTWSAASGDYGSNACGDGKTVSVDFPASIPEMVAVGGTELKNPPPNWDSNAAMATYQQEVLWNDGPGGAAGAGLSIFYAPAPGYQQALGFSSRSVPDLSLLSGLPGIAACATRVGDLSILYGTSAAAPLSAGFFALVASRVGCRLGDVHGALYALGNAQMDGGVQVFHEITGGNNSFDGVPGVSAGPGFGPASGWGSLDVAAVAAAWPACLPASDGGILDAGPGPAYSPCGFIACDGGAVCATVPEGPSGCVVWCPPHDAGSCASGSVCTGRTLFDADGGGACVPGCLTNADCSTQPGTVCEACEQSCVLQGSDAAVIGDSCSDPTQCPTGSFCYNSEPVLAPGGYCTAGCSMTPSAESCPCPSGSTCAVVAGNGFCVDSCTLGTTCGRRGYVCQPLTGGTGGCLGACEVVGAIDTCILFGPDRHCNSSSGICEVSTDGGSSVPDAGPDAGAGGTADSGTPLADSGPATSPAGCHCSSVPDLADTVTAILAFAALRQSRRRRGWPKTQRRFPRD
jgi:hypothetical protein